MSRIFYSLANRLALVMSAITLLVIMIVVLSYFMSVRVQKDTGLVSQVEFPSALLSIRMLDKIGDMNTNVLKYVLGEADERVAFESHRQEVVGLLVRLRETDTIEAARIAEVDNLFNIYYNRVRAEVLDRYDPEASERTRLLVSRLADKTSGELMDLLGVLKEQFGHERLTGDAELQINTLMHDVHLQDEPGIGFYLELMDEASDMVADLDDYVAGNAKAGERFAADSQEFEAFYAELAALEQDNVSENQLKRMNSLHALLHDSGLKILEGYDPAQKTKIVHAMDQLEHDVFDHLEGMLQRLAADADSRAVSSLTDLRSLTARNQVILGAIAGAAIAFCLLIIFSAYRTLTKPVSALNRQMTRLADGDTATRVMYQERRDEIGGMARAVEVFRNHMIARSAAERDLVEARDDAEAASRTKAAFLAAMSHEIRTPMNGVIGMIDLLSQTEMNDDQSQMLATVKDSAFSLLNIIDDILDFSKIEAGKLNTEQIPVSVRDVISGVAETLVPNVVKKGLDLLCFVDPQIPDYVLSDQVRLRQILFNLCGNAIKFTEKGRVVLRADRIDAAVHGKVTVRYQVVDQGIGLSEEQIGNLFKPFSQADFSTTRKFGGTGLGLSICKSLTDLMSGEIGVDSEMGVGSTFWVEMTYDIHPQRDGEIAHDLSGVSVLVVTQDLLRGEFIKCYLEHWQADVQVIDEFEQAETAIRKTLKEDRRFDVVVQGQDWDKQARRELRTRVLADPVLASYRFVELVVDRDRFDRGAANDVVTVDAMPLRRANLITAVAIAADRVSPEVNITEERVADEQRKAISVEEAQARGELILVAEDNPTNQDVIRRQLSVLGYAAEIADDGAKALAAWNSKEYAIVLSDCHMPEMDGYELTDAIRSAEKATGKRIPIIAITANALQGEADKCLVAGMDDYLSKPLDMTKLKQMLKKWMPTAQAGSGHVEVAAVAAAVVEGPGNSNSDSPIDLSFLIECFGDDHEIHRDILQEFVSSTSDYIHDINVAVGGGSAGETASLAHAFKSAARTVGAHELADLCQGPEYAGKSEDLEQIRGLAPRLAPVMKEVAEFVADF